jgi:hypothetical protein
LLRYARNDDNQGVMRLYFPLPDPAFPSYALGTKEKTRRMTMENSKEISRKLKAKQRKAAALLVSGKRGVEIAQILKMRPETLSAWKKIPEFNKLIEKLTDDHHTAMQHQLGRLAEAAITSILAELNRHCDHERQIKVALNVLSMLGIDRIVLPTEVVDDQKNTLENASCSDSLTSAIEAETPSTCNDVTPKLLIPHGTIPA